MSHPRRIIFAVIVLLLAGLGYYAWRRSHELHADTVAPKVAFTNQAVFTMTVSGRVTLNGQPLSGAVVRLGSQSAQTATDGGYLMILTADSFAINGSTPAASLPLSVVNGVTYKKYAIVGDEPALVLYPTATQLAGSAPVITVIQNIELKQ